MHHVINRGNNRQPVFFDEGDYVAFVAQDDEHLVTVLPYIEANPLRARLVEHAGEYRWSSFACHGNGPLDAILDPTPACEA